MRAARAEIDLGAIAHNVRALRELSAPAAVMAVVKADAYGHGLVPVARAALDAGAAWLGVALVEEGLALREAGVRAHTLVLSEPPADALAAAVAAGLATTVYTSAGIGAVAAAARAEGVVHPVHLKVDTGMHRVGADPADAVALARRVSELPSLTLQAVWSHCAVADDPPHPFTATQIHRFEGVRRRLSEHGLLPAVAHLANSAGAIAHPGTRLDLVRCGIAVYGIPPSPAMEGMADLRPAMRLRCEVSLVRRVPAGEGVSYGLRYTTPTQTHLVTVPIGYADGVARRAAEVGIAPLVGGRPRPIAGVVTMDQLVLDCGPDGDVAVGDEVVLIGEQAGVTISANDWGTALGTIGYEVVCGISPRVPRTHLGAPSSSPSS